MLDERALYLINADIDGELEAGEEAELATLLDQSAEARALRAEWIRLTNLIDSLPAAEPPPDLATGILAQVSTPRRRSGFSLAGFWERFQPAPAAAAFATGALLTLGVTEWSGPDAAPGDVTRMVGTMVANPDAVASMPQDRLVLSGPEFSGTVAKGEQGDFVVLEFEFDSAGPAEIFVDLTETGLRFGGIAREWAGQPDEEEQLSVSGGTVRVVNQGRQRFSMFLSRTANVEGGDRSIAIGVNAGGNRAFSGTLRG